MAAQNTTGPLSRRIADAHARVRALRRAIRRSQHLRGRVRFVYSEYRKLPGVHAYDLRDGSGRLRLRHNGFDAFLLDEILGNRVYALPEPVARQLGAGGAEPVIVDLGANIGLATHAFLQSYPRARVVAYEPDPSTVELLRGFVADNDLADRVEIVEACAGEADGEVRFVAAGSPLSGAVDPADPAGEGAIVLRQVDAFPHLLEADLLKIDIEGGEWPILRDPRWRDVKAAGIVLEFHPHSSVSGSPRGEAQALLESAGYVVDLREERGDHGVFWAWRQP
jgi:FkbM family methyltransferase